MARLGSSSCPQVPYSVGEGTSGASELVLDRFAAEDAAREAYLRERCAPGTHDLARERTGRLGGLASAAKRRAGGRR